MVAERAPLILASASPRRAELLAQIRIPFEVRTPDVDETLRAGEAPVDYVQRMAGTKARACVEASRVTLAADTIVEIDGRVLGKPPDREAGIEMLLTLAGREHRVWTAIAATDGTRLVADVVRTRVRFVEFGEALAAAYWATGEAADKAGGYGIQGIGGILAASIEGSYSAVVGLPLAETERLLVHLGVDTWRWRGHG